MAAKDHGLAPPSGDARIRVDAQPTDGDSVEAQFAWGNWSPPDPPRQRCLNAAGSLKPPILQPRRVQWPRGVAALILLEIAEHCYLGNDQSRQRLTLDVTTVTMASNQARLRDARIRHDEKPAPDLGETAAK